MSDDSIIVATHGSFHKLQPNGDVDLSFIPSQNLVLQMVVQPDGKIVASNGSAVFRYNNDGTLDSTITALNVSGAIDIEILDSEKILVGGNFNTVNGFSLHTLMRLNSDGVVD